MQMKRRLLIAMAILLMLGESSCFAKEQLVLNTAQYGGKTPVIADHNCIDIGMIPLEWATKARKELHIAYGHTSHGSQIIDGLLGLTNLKKEPFVYKKGLLKQGSLDLRDNPFDGWRDLGNPDNKVWVGLTREYLKKNKDINVVMWSWCGQMSTASTEYVQNYLDQMQALEGEFTHVRFVYMTGHLDGTGEEGILARNNNQIREFCKQNNKILFDFADIESYNPDGTYFGDKYANDMCEYDSNGDKKPDKNWAKEWQESHTKGVDWYECKSEHSEPVNANMKAYAFWWLAARLGGWDGTSENYGFYAEKLQTLGLFKGTDKGFDLERVPTRLEGAAMLTRLLGGEKEAKEKNYGHPFKDADKTWGSHYVGYLYQKKLTKGVSDSEFGCSQALESNSYMTYLLRILGYSDGPEAGDFSWDNALEAARDLGIIDADYYFVLKNNSFNRGHMARLTYLSLSKKLKGKDMTLLEKLTADNAVDKKAAEQF